ncbi:uncharacterized protein LOC128957741 [Oppia nitens]|uniref:uncharacterized protein LOC128957741 n=1 Tax=Oppia nitens TaxID=1686743 RepID=UPI0023DC4F70|nr:uncharacterized protein LOC128957741 [Oppia nitens]
MAENNINDPPIIDEIIEQELNYISNGAFGYVYKVIDKKTDRVYAVKKVPIIAVGHIHSLEPRLIHRDLKPDNILVDLRGFLWGRGFAKLCDFGLATSDTGYSERAGEAGTPVYRAPEVRRQKLNTDFDGRLAYTYKADIYSLSIIGAMLFEVGNFIDKDRYELFDDITRLYSLVTRDCYSNMLNTFEWLNRMNEFDPDLRPDCSVVLSDYPNWNFDRREYIDKLNARINQVFGYPEDYQHSWDSISKLIGGGLGLTASFEQVIHLVKNSKFNKMYKEDEEEDDDEEEDRDGDEEGNGRRRL